MYVPPLPRLPGLPADRGDCLATQEFEGLLCLPV
jgi:hypothetical protein